MFARNRILQFALLGCVVCAGVAVRIVQTHGTSHVEQQLVPYGSDPYYQLRRVELLLAGDFPPGARDGHVNAPDPFRCVWPVGLPVMLGAASWVFAGPDATRAQIETVSAMSIPFFGAATSLLLAWLFWRRSRSVALLSAFAYAVLPTARMVGHFGRIDHHVVEPLVALGLFILTPSAGVLRPPDSPARAFGFSMLVSLACALTADLTYAALGMLAVLQTALVLLVHQQTERIMRNIGMRP